MPHRSKLLPHKIQKEEQELHIFTNPFINSRVRLQNLNDYQAPLTAHTLSPNSKWITVRNNIHLIRSWSRINTSDVNDPFRDWYLFFQMRRELRLIRERIKQVENRPNFVPVHYFYLPIDETKHQRYNVSNIKPSDALYYSGLGHEPIVLRSLIYYFSKECPVSHNSIFQKFLSDVCSIIHQNRQRLKQAAVFRKLASIITIIFFILIGLMLFSLILSVLKTTSDFQKLYENDPNGGIEWQQPETPVNTF
jgi:hypothetical protein